MAKVNPRCRGQRTECDHEWETRKRQVEPARSQAHPGGAAPPEYEPIQICRKCHAERGGDAT